VEEPVRGENAAPSAGGEPSICVTRPPASSTITWRAAQSQTAARLGHRLQRAARDQHVPPEIAEAAVARDRATQGA
jgi:hypothetical protein